MTLHFLSSHSVNINDQYRSELSLRERGSMLEYPSLQKNEKNDLIRKFLNNDKLYNIAHEIISP